MSFSLFEQLHCKCFTLSIIQNCYVITSDSIQLNITLIALIEVCILYIPLENSDLLL